MLGKEIVDGVLEDLETSAVDDRLKAMLRFLEKMTLHSDQLSITDGEALRAAGVSEAAAIDAAGVALSFNLIVRLADSFKFAIPKDGVFARMAPRMLKGGYQL